MKGWLGFSVGMIIGRQITFIFYWYAMLLISGAFYKRFLMWTNQIAARVREKGAHARKAAIRRTLTCARALIGYNQETCITFHKRPPVERERDRQGENATDVEAGVFISADGGAGGRVAERGRQNSALS